MAFSESRYNIILLSSCLLLLYCSLGQCTNPRRNKWQDINGTLSKSNGERLHWHHGKLLIGLKSEQHGKLKGTKTSKDSDVDLDYQSDMAWEVPELHHGREYALTSFDNTAVERLLKMDPTVDCSGGYMRLEVQDADTKPGALLFMDRGELSPLPLSKLPKSCGYKIHSTHRDLVLLAPYDGCFVVVEETCYVLPLYWLGVPVQLSCPLTQPSSNQPMVTCHTGGMVVKTDWTLGVSEINVNLNGNWVQLLKASSMCGFSVVEHPEGVAISINYYPCMKKKDGMYSIELGTSGDGEIKLSCPSLAPTDSTTNPLMDFRLLSTPAPTQIVKIPVQTTQGQTWHQFYPLPLYPQSPKQESSPAQPVVPKPADGEMVGQQFYPLYPEQPLPDVPYPESVEQQSDDGPTVKEEQIYHPGSMFYPALASRPSIRDPAYPSQSETSDYPSQDPTQLYYPEFYSEPQMPQPVYPFYLQRDPIRPTAAPEKKPNRPAKTEGPVPRPIYLYPLYHPTEQPNDNDHYDDDDVPISATPPPLVPQIPQGQKYQFFGPYYYQLSSQHMIPTPQKLQDPPVSEPDDFGVPQNPQSVCPQYCPVGLASCCPQIAFHQHLHHFVPVGHNINANPPIYPGLPRFTSELGDDFGFAPQPVPRKAQTPRRHTTFTKTLASPQFPSFGEQHEKQTNQRPLDGNLATLPEHNPSERTDSQQPAFPQFVPNVYYPYMLHLNHKEHQGQSGARSGGPPEHFSQLPDPVHRTNVYAPRNVQFLQQSDGPFLNAPATDLVSKTNRYLRQSSGNANENVKRPNSESEPHLVPYHVVQDSQEPSHMFFHTRAKTPQTLNALKETTEHEETDHSSSDPKSYLLLKHGPPGRDTRHFQSPPPRQVVRESDKMGYKLTSNNPNNPQTLKPPQGQSENSKWLEENLGNAELTPGYEPGPLPQIPASVGPDSAPLSQELVVGRTKVKPVFRHPRKPITPFGYRRQISHHNVSE